MSDVRNVGIVVALKEEFEVLERTLSIAVTPEQHSDVVYITYNTEYKTAYGADLKLVFLVMDDQANTTSSSATTWFVGRHNFDILINIGIAGLLSKDNHLLDVIIGEGCHEYGYRQKAIDNTEGNNFEIIYAGRYFSTTKQFPEAFSQLKHLCQYDYKKWENDSKNRLEKSIDAGILNNLKKKELLKDIQVIDKGILASGDKLGSSQAFKKFVLTQNRLEKALEMESAGFLYAISNQRQPPLTLIIKAISDPADERKKELDSIKDGVFREMAMQNASSVLKIFLDKYNFSTGMFNDDTKGELGPDKDYLYTKTLAGLNSHFKMNFSGEALKLWGKIFFLIGDQKNIALEEERFIEGLLEYINGQDSETPLYILGNPGSGISPCLSVLYQAFYKNYLADKAQYYPIYIDFRKFIGGTNKDLSSQTEKYIEDEWLPFLNSHDLKKILLIYDEADYTSKFQTQLENSISKNLSSFSRKKIIGRRASINRERTRQRESNGAEITFRSISIENEQFNKLLHIYSMLENKEIDDSDRLKAILEKCRFNEIDIFLLRLIFNNINSTFNKHKSVYYLFDEFCMDHIEKIKSQGKNYQDNFSIDRLAEFAFNYLVVKNKFEENELCNNPAWYLLNRNKEIQHFLIAKHIINVLLLIAEKEEYIEFNYIHDHKVNSYSKYLVNIDPPTQEAVFNATKIVLNKEKKFYAHANAMYLLGRLEYDALKERAIGLIKEYMPKSKEKYKHKPSVEDNRKFLFALRTAYISLACLGESSASGEYVEKLILHHDWCTVNRGFHLLYYGDKSFDPGIGFNPEDKLGDCSKTYLHLYNRIKTLRKEPLRDIEIYTFFSLIQQRYLKNNFTDENKLKEATDLIDNILEKDIVEYTGLKSYLKMLKKIFESSNYSRFTLLKQISALKFEKRKGWVHRNFKGQIETVASHTLNAVYMASLLLPNSSSDSRDRGYKKSRIMDMLLYHDLAESLVHDHLPEEKTALKKKEEDDFYETLVPYRTCGLFNTRSINSLWKEYDSKVTTNSKIANDIDKLEGYAQFLSYLESGEEVEKPVFKKWRDEIASNTQTRLGRKIKDNIEFEFQSIIKEYSE
ncbi:MAG: HD domain-containing protein [Treponema sp.]|nr:HD domain-containing protein [Treponema sp.]